MLKLTYRIFVILLLSSCSTEDSNDNTTDDNMDNDPNSSVQDRLNSGETPYSIYLSDADLITQIIGSEFQGGRIFYLNLSNGEGLISIDFDLTDKAYGPCTPFESADLGNSQINSGAYVPSDIHLYTEYYVNTCAVPGNAVQLCSDFVYNGYDDWFLPDLQTMIHMGNSQVLDNLGGKYWCADPAGLDFRNQVYDYSTNFKYLSNIDFSNQLTFAVRPVRYFNPSSTNSLGVSEPTSIAEKLASGKSPWELMDEGVLRENIYGEFYGGGLITYLNESQRSGMVAGIHHRRWDSAGVPLYEWGCYGSGINDSDGNGLNGNGTYNSTLIANSGCSVASNSPAEQEIAAVAALNYSTNHISQQSYDDWYLPNLTELGYFENIFQSSNSETMINNYYWSSNTSDALFYADAILFPSNEIVQRRRDAAITLMVPVRTIAE